MSKYVIEDTTLTAIGDAIREKDGTTEPILVGDFASKIAAITAGGGGELGFVTLSNPSGMSTSHKFDASAYIGTEDNQPFYVVVYTAYSIAKAQPCILYYSGSGFSKVFGDASNSNYLANRIRLANCNVASGVITIGIETSTYLGDSSTSNNVIQLFYMKSGV